MPVSNSAHNVCLIFTICRLILCLSVLVLLFHLRSSASPVFRAKSQGHGCPSPEFPLHTFTSSDPEFPFTCSPRQIHSFPLTRSPRQIQFRFTRSPRQIQNFPFTRSPRQIQFSPHSFTSSDPVSLHTFTWSDPQFPFTRSPRQIHSFHSHVYLIRSTVFLSPVHLVRSRLSPSQIQTFPSHDVILPWGSLCLEWVNALLMPCYTSLRSPMSRESGVTKVIDFGGRALLQGLLRLVADVQVPTLQASIQHPSSHTPCIAFRHLPPNSANLATPLKGHSLSPPSCPPTRSAPSGRFGY